MPTKFFITHSWKDLDFAKKFCDDLRRHGVDGFFDVYSIKPGDKIPTEISRGLEACDTYVPILSYASLHSPWCEEEINAALTLSNSPGRNGLPRIIPVLIEDCQDKMPVLLRTRLYIQFAGRYDDALQEFLKGCGTPVPRPGPDVLVPPDTAEQPTAPTITTASPLLKTIPHVKVGNDGTQYILVPAGEFIMGNDKGREDERPVHRVYASEFYISRTTVTNAQYKKFLDANPSHPLPAHWNHKTRTFPAGKENHPVVYVSWRDASRYAEWAGLRLPTEAEWEKAARGTDGRRCPWGDRFDKCKCNTSESGIQDTTPVDTYPDGASPYGVLDMIGNVWEWVADWHVDNYYSQSPDRDPTGPSSGHYRSMRGNSWRGTRDLARCSVRGGGEQDYRESHIGFRVAESIIP